MTMVMYLSFEFCFILGRAHLPQWTLSYTPMQIIFHHPVLFTSVYSTKCLCVKYIICHSCVAFTIHTRHHPPLETGNRSWNKRAYSSNSTFRWTFYPCFPVWELLHQYRGHYRWLTPTHWSYCSLALSHRYELIVNSWYNQTQNGLHISWDVLYCKTND